MNDVINHPEHYTQARVTIEPIDVLRFAPFDLGNALKYILRAGHKGDARTDWEKAKFYLTVADESYRVNPHAYENFYKSYRIFLQKFKRLEYVAEPEDVLPFLDELWDLCIDEIVRVKNEAK